MKFCTLMCLGHLGSSKTMMLCPFILAAGLMLKSVKNLGVLISIINHMHMDLPGY